MKEALYKPMDVQGPRGLWGFFNTPHRNLTASVDGYLLTVAPEKILRLDEFTPEQEAAFWDFTFAKATEGLTDNCARGFKNAADLQKDTSQYTVICALNDGPVAWQGVGTVHGHVIWVKGESAPGDISERLIADRTKFAGSAEPYRPLASLEVDLSRVGYADDICHAREILRAKFIKAGTPPEDVGFSLYTKHAYGHDPLDGGTMVVELWSREHHAVASFTQFTRYWNGLWENPVSGNQMGLQYRAFRPETPNPA